MVTKKLLIITGITGFIGSHLDLSSLIKEYVVVGLSSDKIFNIKSKVIEISENKYRDILNTANVIEILHLATFYSFEKNDDDLVIEANEIFGEKLFKNLDKSKIKKVIYTNSYFTFFEDRKIKNSTYVKSKNKFSKFLQEIAKENSINYSEVFLANNFGLNDDRKKIIPEVISSIKLNKPSPINNPEEYINLLPIDTVCFNLISELEKQNRRIFFLSEYDYNVSSIYNFCYNIINKNKVNKIDFKLNSNKLNIPSDVKLVKINYNLESELIKLITPQ